MKSALGQYEVDIQLSAETAQVLQEEGFALYAFKAVQTSSAGAAPLVWATTTQLLETTSIAWQDQYQAYISSSQIIPNAVILAAAVAGVAPGQTAYANRNGYLTVADGGQPSTISILNEGPQPWTCGVSQTFEGRPAPVCALPLFGNMMDIVTPLERVLVMFATNTVNAGTVVYKAYAPGLLIDLTGAAQRTVQFDINTGWSWGAEPWGQSIPAMTDLIPWLIRS